MSSSKSERGRALTSAMFLLLAVALAPGTAPARLLILESPLESLAPIDVESRRLEFGTEYFGAYRWAGQRHLIRYTGSRANGISWSLALPWLYSTYANGGRGGRDNLHVSAGLPVPTGEARRLRLGSDLWLPFASNSLYPLAQRRAFARVSLLADLGGREHFFLRSSLAYRVELEGLGPETEGDSWSDHYSLDLRMGHGLAGGWRVFLASALDWPKEEELLWWRGGAGFGLDWSGGWSLEMAVEFAHGDEAYPDRLDHALRLRLRREISVAEPDESAAPHPMGSEPPPGLPAGDPESP